MRKMQRMQPALRSTRERCANALFVLPLRCSYGTREQRSVALPEISLEKFFLTRKFTQK